jgi:hypothetical protein
MFNLDEQLRRWRQETEATLAFEPEEIDELEDHLKLAVEKAVAEGASPEQAWSTAIARVGASPSLALEFAKSKLMPALFHLMTSWWKPLVLLLTFLLLECFIYQLQGPNADGSTSSPDAMFWLVTWSSFVILFILLPGRALKIAFLLGVGNAFSLIPLLHVAFYNSLGDRIVGAGWSRMSPAFGAIPTGLGLIGLIAINMWAWRRTRCNRAELPAILALAAAILLLLTISPFISCLIGNLSIRETFSMPTAHDITLSGQARINFMTWKFVDVLVTCILIVTTWLPLVLMMVASTGTLALQGIIRMIGTGKPPVETTFPAPRDLPWIATLAGTGVCWVMACFVEPAFTQQIGLAEADGFHAPGVPFGLAFMTLAPAFLFLICGYELTKRLRRAALIGYFYTSMLVVVEAAVLLGVTLLPALTPIHLPARTDYLTSEPPWLSAILGLAVAVMASHQVLLIGKKVRAQTTTTSLWKFDGNDLVQFGSLLGLVLACSGLILMMVAYVLSFESTAMISAMIAWGNSIKDPSKNHFDPGNYSSAGATVSPFHYPTQLVFWIFSGASYIALCLIIGLTVAIILSGLEFIRFNTFRLYRARKASRMAPSTLALNE